MILAEFVPYEYQLCRDGYTQDALDFLDEFEGQAGFADLGELEHGVPRDLGQLVPERVRMSFLSL